MAVRFARSERRSILRIITAVVFVSATAVVLPPPAAASSPMLLVSTDGIHYTPQSTLPLFSEEWRLVPGDADVMSLWVKNGSASAGLLRIDLLDPSADDPTLAASVVISAAPELSAASDVTISSAITNGSCTVLSGDRVVSSGEAVRVEVSARVSTALTDVQGSAGTVDFHLRGALADAAVARHALPGSACAAMVEEQSQAEELPHTGGTLALTAIPIGVAAVVAGCIAFVIGNRTRKRQRRDA